MRATMYRDNKNYQFYIFFFVLGYVVQLFFTIGQCCPVQTIDSVTASGG
jgi:hypothetical protein